MSNRRTKTKQRVSDNGVRGSLNITAEFSVSGDDRGSPVSRPTATQSIRRSLQGPLRQPPPSHIPIRVPRHYGDSQDQSTALSPPTTPVSPQNDAVASSSSSPPSSASSQSWASTLPSPCSSVPTSPQVQSFPISDGTLKGKGPGLQPALEPSLLSDGGVSFKIPQHMFEIIYRDGKAWGVFHPIVECDRLAKELEGERERREMTEEKVGRLQQELNAKEQICQELERARREIEAKEEEIQKLAEELDQDLKKQREQNRWYDRFLAEIKRLQGEPEEISETLLELLREAEEKNYDVHLQPETENEGSEEQADPNEASLEPQLTQTDLMVMSIEPTEHDQEAVNNGQVTLLQERIDQLHQEKAQLETRREQTENDLRDALQRQDEKDEEVVRLNELLVVSNQRVIQTELDAAAAHQLVRNLRADLLQEQMTIWEKNTAVALLSGLLAGVMANLNESREGRQQLQRDLANSQSGQNNLQNLLRAAESSLVRTEGERDVARSRLVKTEEERDAAKTERDSIEKERDAAEKAEEEGLAKIEELKDRIKKLRDRLHNNRRRHHRHHRSRRHGERPGKPTRCEIVRGRSGGLSATISGRRRRGLLG